MSSTADVQRAEHTLAGSKMLEPVDRAAIAKLEALCTWRTVREGEPIVTRDSDSRDVFFVVKGRCRIVNYSPSGREVAYAIAGAGEFFGEMAAIDGLLARENVTSTSVRSWRRRSSFDSFASAYCRTLSLR